MVRLGPRRQAINAAPIYPHGRTVAASSVRPDRPATVNFLLLVLLARADSRARPPQLPFIITLPLDELQSCDESPAGLLATRSLISA